MLLQKNQSCLVLIDIQEKLTPLVNHAAQLVSSVQWLLRLATELDVPLLVSEQYPQGLGKTVEPLRQWIPGQTEIEKIYFSCLRDATFAKHWQMLNKKQAVLAGIETHVCVLQTALDLNAAGIDVFVVVDAVSSRHELDHQCALERMQQEGIHLVTHEMVFFEWVEHAGTSAFKALSQAFLKNQ